MLSTTARLIGCARRYPGNIVKNDDVCSDLQANSKFILVNGVRLSKNNSRYRTMRPTMKSSHAGQASPSRERIENTLPQPLLSPTPPQSLAQKNFANPLSSKVNLVLSTSYADAEFRDVLSLIDDRQVKNSAPARRQLRLQLQKEVIESNGELVCEFGDVAKQLRRIGATINAITEDFESMKSTLGVVHERTSAILDEASTLINQREQVQHRGDILKRFQNHFILSQDEVNALTLPGEPVNTAFFDAVSRAKSIQKDCEHLLGFEDQTLGLGLMEQLSRHLDLAFQKLYKWVLREFQGSNHENPQMSGTIRRGLRLLSEKPSLFQNCLGVFSEARQRVLSDSFYLALTGVSPSGVPDNSTKPIELAAHDPLRYVGDMLAWAHSATVGEKEFFQSLFTPDRESAAREESGLGGPDESWTLPPRSDDDEGLMNSDPTEALKQLVDHSLSGVSQALQQRIAQAIQTNEEIIQAYKLSNLMGFYRSLFSDILGPDSHFLECLRQIEAEALRQFRSLMREYIAGLQGTFQQAPPGLKAPGFLQESLGQLSALMKTYDTSLHESSDRAAGFEPVLVEALDPFLAGCESVGRDMNPRSRAIFLINCNLAVIETLKPFKFAEERIERLQGSMRQEMELLRDTQLVFFMEHSGLDRQLSVAAGLEVTLENAKALRSHRDFQPEVLVEASASLDEFLPSALIDATENLESLQASSLARQLTEEAAEIFCRRFEHMENLLLMDEDEGGDVHARGLLTRTSVEVRVLLS